MADNPGTGDMDLAVLGDASDGAGDGSGEDSASRVTLTEEIAQKLNDLWVLGGREEYLLTDREIAEKVGVTFGQLRGWLQRDTRPLRKDGTQGPLGLRDIRTRARAQTKIGFLQGILRTTVKLENEGDYRAARDGYMWLLEKMFPKEFGALVGSGEREEEGDMAEFYRRAMQEHDDLYEVVEGQVVAEGGDE